MAQKKSKKAEESMTLQMNTLFKELYVAFIEKSMTTEEMLEKLINIEHTKFSDYMTWIPLSRLIMLKSYLVEDQPEVKEFCKDRVEAVVGTGTDDHIEAFNMMLEGELTGLSLLSQAKADNDKEWERSLYVLIIAQLVTIVEMGGSRKFGRPVALRTLEKYLKDARRYW